LSRDEQVPKFISGELVPLYNRTDLSYTYVHIKCRELGALKMINIDPATIKAWYIEFIRLGWSKQLFDERFENLKRSKIFGSIDFYNWIADGTSVYGEFEIQRLVSEKVNSLILKGRKLRQMLKRGYDLTEDEKRIARLDAYNELKSEWDRQRAQAFETYKNILKKKRRDKITQRKQAIMLMKDEMKANLVKKCFDEKIFEGMPAEYYQKYLVEYADLIPDNLIKEVING